MSTAIHRMVERARAGSLPNLVGRMPSGWLILGETQITRGYALLLPDPVGAHLNALAPKHLQQFLQDMAKAGEVLLGITGAVRMNYEMLGNLEPALHAHIIPRYAIEDEAIRTKAVWLHDWQKAPAFDPVRDQEIVHALRQGLAL